MNHRFLLMRFYKSTIITKHLTVYFQIDIEGGEYDIRRINAN